MNIVMIPEGAKVMQAMIGSCGDILDCKQMMAALAMVAKETPIEELGQRPDGSWRPAFERLKAFAQKNKLTSLGAFEVAWYFGSAFHADIMLRGGYRKLGDFLGFEKGLVAHLLLPLNDQKEYRNSGYKLSFANTIEVNPEDSGTPCYHLGYLVRVPLAEEQIERIIKDQSQNKFFMKALQKISGSTIKTPDEIVEAAEYEKNPY